MKNLVCIFLVLFTFSTFISCKDDPIVLQSSTVVYQFHNGQTVPSAPYGGIHPTDFSASMELEEKDNGNTMITVTLNNTVEGETYRIHAHDAADAATTPNGTPYSETPNSDILVQQVEGNGGSVSVSQEAKMEYSKLLTTYDGFFVVHDPLQAISTSDISTYLIVGSFARTQVASDLKSTSFDYDFNTGQVAEAFTYAGTHASDLSAQIIVDELADDRSRVTVKIMNTMDGQTYHTHAHDAADPAVTPNGTPYDESPNADVFVSAMLGNGSTIGEANISSMSYSQVTSSYEGFFVVHDPLQAVTTTDPTTYVILGSFAR